MSLVLSWNTDMPLTENHTVVSAIMAFGRDRGKIQNRQPLVLGRLAGVPAKFFS